MSLRLVVLPVLALLGAVCLIFGGVCLRFLVVYCDDRRELDGEALYLRRLPHGNELFMKKNW